MQPRCLGRLTCSRVVYCMGRSHCGLLVPALRCIREGPAVASYTTGAVCTGDSVGGSVRRVDAARGGHCQRIVSGGHAMRERSSSSYLDPGEPRTVRM